MKGQVKALAVAIALAAGSANASIEGSTLGNGELFFSIYDKVTKVAYTKDLGIHMNDFLPGGTAARNSLSFDLSGDTYWNQFKAGATSPNTLWMIGALDGTDSASTGGTRVLTTSNAAATTIDNQTNSNLNQFALVDGFLSSVNVKGTHVGSTVVNGSAFTTSLNDGNAYPNATYKVETWSQKTTGGWKTTATAATPLSFYLLTNSNGDEGLAAATLTTFADDSAVNQTWAVNYSGSTLNWNAGTINEPIVTPIPAAAWLLGSALLGLVGVGRRQAKNNVVAA